MTGERTEEGEQEDRPEKGLSGELLRHFQESYKKNREAMEELARR